MAASNKQTTVIGNSSNFWLFNEADGFDLTHPTTPTSLPIYPRLKMHTTNTPITISPQKTALVIIDMQNFFLCPALGRPRGAGHDAEEALLQYAIPAARKAGIQIVWVTWGLTEEDLDAMPPTVLRSFGFRGEEAKEGEDGGQIGLSRLEKKTGRGLGSPFGNVELEDGTTVDAGRALMRGSWNAEMHGRLQTAFEDGKRAPVPDVRFEKNRISGLWEPRSALHDFLQKQGIKTLMFTGVNTDQCVLATVQDAGLKGYDTVLLRDGCGTSREYARRMVEYNCEKVWGFVSNCKGLAESVEKRLNGGQRVASSQA